MNTSCKKCYFASAASSNQPCRLKIIDLIKDTKILSVVDGFYQIEDYFCRYGVSKEIYETKIKDMNIDIESYAINRIIPKYLLYIISNGNNNSIDHICNQITKLTIKPEAVSIVTRKNYDNSIDAIKCCEKILNTSVDWKLHIRLDDDHDEKAAKNILSTDQRCSNCQFIFFVREELFDNIVENDSIGVIDMIVHRLQPKDISILCSKLNSDYFNGIFMRMDNFKNSTSVFQENISNIIKEHYQDFIGFYD